MVHALWWWLVAQLVAACATPLCLRLFRPLADRGYGLSKAFGLLLFGYVAWLLGVLRLLENGPLLLAVALALVAGGSYLVWRDEGGALAAFWRRRRGLLLLEEGIFLGTYLGFLALRSYSPEIAGTEKFMDFAFMNAVTRSASFPPLDPWLAPSPAVPHPTINYYHFGYLIQGLLLELTRVSPAIGFNLGLGLLFGLTALAVFSLAYGLTRDVVAERAGVGGWGLGVRGGQRAARRPHSPSPARLRGPAQRAAGPGGEGPNPQPPTPNPRPTWSLRAAWPYAAAGALAVYLLLVAGNLWAALRRFDNPALWQKDFWQGIGWNATRVLVIKQGGADVDYTINEFPVFSFLLGDLHPHVLALPFALVAVGLAYAWLLQPPRLFRWAVAGEAVGGGQWEVGSGRGHSSLITHHSSLPVPAGHERWARLAPFAELVPGALVLGSLYFLNSWDFPAYFVLALAAALVGAWWHGRRTPDPLPPSPSRGEGELPSRPSGEEGELRPTAAGAALPSPLEGEGPGVRGRASSPVGAAFPLNRLGRGGQGVRALSWLRAAVAVLLLGALAVALFLPFHLTFRPPVVADGGALPIGLVTRRSQLDQFLQFWGAQFLLLAPTVLVAAGVLGGVPFVRRAGAPALAGWPDRAGDRAGASAIVARGAPGWDFALPLAAGLALVVLAERAGAGVLALCLLLAAAAGWAALRMLGVLAPVPGPGTAPAGLQASGLRRSEANRPLAFAFGVICLAALLLAACEVVYIRDFYGGALRRMNTVFKFYYQAWLLFAVGGSVATFWLLRELRRMREAAGAADTAGAAGAAGARLAWTAFASLCALLLVATLQYPLRVTLLRTNGFQNPATLDGMDWMRRAHPDDHAAAQWLRQHGATPGRAGAPRAPVVLEATGGPYSEFARIATQTGFPTVLGWDQHERLWRGARISAEVDARKRDVETIYRAGTMEEARPLLDKYNVAYVVVGYLEQSTYGQSGGLAKFDGAAGAPGLEVAFRQGQTTIYRTDKAGT